MLVRLLSIVCYINVLICAMKAMPHTEKMGANSFSSDLSDSTLYGRFRRVVPTALRSLFRKSDLVYKVKNYEVYSRKGGTGQALRDWKELKPKDVADFGLTKWGDVGDRTVMLDMEDGRVVLNVLATKTVPDGDIVRVISRIKYSEGAHRPYFPGSKN